MLNFTVYDNTIRKRLKKYGSLEMVSRRKCHVPVIRGDMALHDGIRGGTLQEAVDKAHK